MGTFGRGGDPCRCQKGVCQTRSPAQEDLKEGRPALAATCEVFSDLSQSGGPARMSMHISSWLSSLVLLKEGCVDPFDHHLLLSWVPIYTPPAPQAARGIAASYSAVTFERCLHCKGNMRCIGSTSTPDPPRAATYGGLLPRDPMRCMRCMRCRRRCCSLA